MTRADRDFLCWLAGFIDGEGSIGIHRHFNYRTGKESFQVQLQIGQHGTRRWVLESIVARIGGNLYKSNQMAHLCWSGRKALKVLRAVYPYLVLKKEQAGVFISGMEKWPLIQGRRPTPEESVYRSKLANSVNSYNFKGGRPKGSYKRPSQAAETVYEVDDAEGVEVMHEPRKGRDDPASLVIAS